MLNIKTISRIAAIQTFYQRVLSDQSQDIKTIAQKMLDFYNNDESYDDSIIEGNKNSKIKLSISYFWDLIQFTEDKLNKIDDIIAKNLDQDKTIGNITPLLLAILRVAICEIKFFEHVPRKVVINEFTNIASQMLSDTETGFVNFILDKIVKQDTNV